MLAGRQGASDVIYIRGCGDITKHDAWVSSWDQEEQKWMKDDMVTNLFQILSTWVASSRAWGSKQFLYHMEHCCIFPWIDNSRPENYTVENLIAHNLMIMIVDKLYRRCWEAPIRPMLDGMPVVSFWGPGHQTNHDEDEDDETRDKNSGQSWDFHDLSKIYLHSICQDSSWHLISEWVIIWICSVFFIFLDVHKRSLKTWWGRLHQISTITAYRWMYVYIVCLCTVIGTISYLPTNWV